MRSIPSIVMTILLLLSICSVLKVFGGTPPSLTLFSPQINGLTVTINGVTTPGMPGTDITKIHWDWDDGYSEDHWFANSHTYPNNGVHIITITSYQSDGLTTTKARIVSLGVPPKTPILLLVNETIYPSIANRLSVFKQDLSFDGYDAIISLLSNGLDPCQIKSIINSYYTENNITGCVLIGDIRAAYTEFRTGDSSSVWISLDATDMYYMDLDGYWENVTHPDFYAHRPPGDTRQVFLYESCQTFYNEYIVYLNESKKWDYNAIENKAQYKAEIWVSRIIGHNLAILGKNEADIINGFLDWDHAFRTERKRIEDRVYLLNAVGSGYNDQNMNYSSIFDSIVKEEYVTKNDYLNCLRNPNGSKLIYLTAHSGPQVHCLYDANLMVDELANSNKTSVFYILNACSSCRWDQYVSSPTNPNYLGGMYVFDKSESDYGLGAIGFTGVGGFNLLEFFTDYLNANPYGGYGEAYKYWFNENLMRIFTAWNYVYLGDPIIGPSSPRLVRNIDTGLRYEKIQEAINAIDTQDGHTIVVGAGTYYENVVVNKKISLLGENRERTIIDGKSAGNTISVIANGVLIGNLTATNCGEAYPNSGIFLNNVDDTIVTCSTVSYNKGHGIFVMWGTNNSLLNNVIEYNAHPGIRVDGTAAPALIANNAIEHNQPDGIFLYSAYHVLIENNTILNNKQCGITPQGGSTDITIIHNYVLNNGWHGICFVDSNDSLIEANTLSKNGFSGMDFVGSSDHNNISGNIVGGNNRGISFYESSNNSIYHNNFWNNTSQVNTYNSTNSWDDGYPSGGNYWSNYDGSDTYSGPNQDIPGSDGIGDAPYVVDANSQDRYPFIFPLGRNIAIENIACSKTVVGQGYGANINVTVTNQGNLTETFNVTVYGNTTIIETREFNLTSGNSKDITFTWSTAGVAKGYCTISAYAWPVPGETNKADNMLTGSLLKITIVGDVNGDGKVNLIDVFSVALAYGSYPGHPTWNPNYDINNDGKINLIDYFTTALNYGKTDP